MTEYTEMIESNYKTLETEELLGRVRSGNLTESAHEIAISELKRRGIDPNDSSATDSGKTDSTANSANRDAQGINALRRSSRPLFLFWGVVFMFAIKIVGFLGIEGGDKLIHPVVFLISLMIVGILGGLFWGYVAWWIWSRWRYR